MSANRQWAIVGAIVAALGALLIGATLMTKGVPVVGPGARAPDFAAQTVPDSGAAVITKGIAAYRGKAVLLNIWATWCAPCRDEMPRIQKLNEELGPLGLAIVAISIDNPGMTGAIRDFKKEFALSFEILHDESGKIRDDYQTSGVPETFLIDKEGVVRRRLIGAAWTVDDQRALLRELIAEPAR